MGTPTSGTISLNEVHIEAGGSSGSQVSFSDSDIRVMCAQNTLFGQFSMSDMYSRAADFQASATVGYGSTHFQQGYANFTTNYKGFVNGVTSPANLSPTSESDYMGGGTIGNISVAQLSSSSNVHTFAINANNTPSASTPNDDVNVFNSVVVNTTTYDRGDFTFSNSGNTCQLSFVVTVPSGFFVASDTINPPFPAHGTTYYVTFRRRV
tara:strand:- start:2555 stop:3181 length:627 start_codon:yes stop_codon:yes gene_type:complete